MGGGDKMSGAKMPDEHAVGKDRDICRFTIWDLGFWIYDLGFTVASKRGDRQHGAKLYYLFPLLSSCRELSALRDIEGVEIITPNHSPPCAPGVVPSTAE